jgi:beta-lactam-binding protein with PASTA domain
VPDVVRLKRAPAEAALAAAGCGAKVTKKRLKRTKKNRKRRGRVLRQLTPAGATVAPGTTIGIKVGKLRKR